MSFPRIKQIFVTIPLEFFTNIFKFLQGLGRRFRHPQEQLGGRDVVHIRQGRGPLHELL